MRPRTDTDAAPGCVPAVGSPGGSQVQSVPVLAVLLDAGGLNGIAGDPGKTGFGTGR